MKIRRVKGIKNMVMERIVADRIFEGEGGE